MNCLTKIVHIKTKKFFTFNSCRKFHYSNLLYKSVPKNVSSAGSVTWMTRHINDPYVKMSRYENYRARSAFKLIEIDDKFKLLKSGHCVVDCGAAPGAWTQVAVERVNSTGRDAQKAKGMVIGVDINSISPIPGAVLFPRCDFTTNECKENLMSKLNGTRVNVVLSDMCPNISGSSQIDSERITDLAFHALRFAVTTLLPGGHVVIKGFDEMKRELFSEAIMKFFETVKRVKPNASRGDSSEMFYVGLNFKGKKEIKENT